MGVGIETSRGAETKHPAQHCWPFAGKELGLKTSSHFTWTTEHGRGDPRAFIEIKLAGKLMGAVATHL